VKYARIYSYRGEPMADVMFDHDATRALTLMTPMDRRLIGPDQEYRYCRWELKEQLMLTTRPRWLEPT
jgi:hypothetical protein